MITTINEFRKIFENTQSVFKLKVYHGTNNNFKKFDISKSYDGGIWFTDNLESIKNHTTGGAGNKYIMTRYITLNKPAGWDEYEKYSIDELIGMGYDGVILPEIDKTDYIVFYNKNISKTINEFRKILENSNNLNDNFYKWFGNSKIIDKNGNPLIVYHGSTFEFDKFNECTYFTNDYMNADGYAGGNYVYECYLNIKNPLIIDGQGKKWDDIKTIYGTSTRDVVANIDSSKYDGIIFNNIKDSWIDDEDYQDTSTVYVTFSSNQIKSIENNGTWNINDDNIYN